MDVFKLIALLLAAVALGVSGCDSESNQNDTPEETPPSAELPDWELYENQLQRPLFDLANSDGNEARSGQFAAESIEVVQVEIQLDPSRELPTGYLILEEGRAQLGDTLTVQAYVRVDELLELSQEEQVIYIRTPTRPRR